MKMQSSQGDWGMALDVSPNVTLEGAMPRIPSNEIFVQTPQGAAAAVGQPADLPERLRTLLFLINGRRRMSEYRDLLPRYRNIDDIFDLLARKGYIERLVDREPGSRIRGG
jgi:hypothetical protein